MFTNMFTNIVSNSGRPAARFIFHFCLLIALLIASVASTRAQAEGQDAAASPGAKVYIDNVTSGETLMTYPLTLTINGLTEALASRQITSDDLVLTLNGHSLNGLKARQLDENTLELRLAEPTTRKMSGMNCSAARNSEKRHAR